MKLREWAIKNRIIGGAELRRLIWQNGVKVNNQVISSEFAEIKNGDKISIGKQRMYEVNL